MPDGHRGSAMLLRGRLATVVGFALLCCASAWPQIMPVEREFSVSQPANIHLETAIQSASGSDLYKVICRDGNEEDEDFAYSGLIQCRLVGLSGESHDPDLLAQPGATRDWLSRGRFLYDELTGNCRDDSEWGRRRTFALRNMRLVIAIEDFHTSDESKNDPSVSYKLVIQAAPDPKATNRDDLLVPVPDGDGPSDCSRKREWWAQPK